MTCSITHEIPRCQVCGFQVHEGREICQMATVKPLKLEGLAMATAHVFLKVTMAWDFEESELSNLMEGSTIHLPSGDEIKGGIKTMPYIDCLSVVLQRY